MTSGSGSGPQSGTSCRQRAAKNGPGLRGHRLCQRLCRHLNGAQNFSKMAGTAHTARMDTWVAEDSLIAALDADQSLLSLRDSSLASHHAPGYVHGAIGKMLSWHYLKHHTAEVTSAVKFLYGAQGPPDTAHGGQIASFFDHVYGVNRHFSRHFSVMSAFFNQAPVVLTRQTNNCVFPP